MSYTDLRDFEAEYTVTVDGVTVAVEKLGGGTVGRTYEGSWRYVVTAPDGAEITRGQGFTTGTPTTHRRAALQLADLFLGESE